MFFIEKPKIAITDQLNGRTGFASIIYFCAHLADNGSGQELPDFVCLSPRFGERDRRSLASQEGV